MQRYTIVSDLDGTLLDSDHKLSDYTKEVILELTANGFQMAIATGRHYADAKAIRDILDLNSFLITSNGATVHDENDKLVICHRIDSSIIEDVFFNFGINGDILLNLYTEDKWLTNKPKADLADYHQDSGFNYEVVDFKQLKDYSAVKAYFTCNDIPILKKLEEKILSRYGNELSVTYAMPFCLEVMKKGVNKGDALQQILEQRGGSIQNTIAFGDGLNDFEMLSMVGQPYMMNNATQELKQLLPNIPNIGNNYDHAVAKFLKEEFLRASA